MSDEKLEQGVFKIFRLTHEGRLKWELAPVPRGWERSTDTVFPLYFETHYQGRKLALFQRRAKSRTSDSIFAAAFGGKSEVDWNQSVRLALLSDNDEILFEFPASRQVQDLFDTVRYKASNVDEFLDELLKPESVSEK